MKLSDFKGEEAIDVLAEITEPLANILCDKEIKELAEKKAIPAKYVKPALKNHKEDVIYILAVLNRKTVEDFKEELNLLNLPIMLIELINDEQVQNLFRSQGQMDLTSLASSGSAMENTEAKEN